MKRETIFNALNLVREKIWKDIQAGTFWRMVMEQGFDKNLYELFMHQLYYYTRHNSINQAVAALRVEPENISLLRFVYKHALEELGHENMIVHDLKSIGLAPPSGLDNDILPATRALIAYIYYVAMEKGAKARLGYSFWAENVYGGINGMVKIMKNSLNLRDENMTFFVAHASIDESHAQYVDNMIENHIRTEEELHEICATAETTLFLTAQMLEQIIEKYNRMQQKVAANA